MEQCKNQETTQRKYSGITEELLTKAYAMSHARLYVARQEENNLIKRPILNLEAFVRIHVETDEGAGSFKADKHFVAATGLSEEELWEAARRNTAETLGIYTFEEMLGIPEELLGDTEDGTMAPFHVCTTKDRMGGAAALCCPEVFHDFCEERGLSSVFLVPSSTEELLILQQMEMDAYEFAQMVDEINESAVEPELRLEPVIYLYTKEDNSIVIAARARQIAIV